MNGSTSFDTIKSYLPDRIRRLLITLPRDRLDGLMEIRLRAGGTLYIVYLDSIMYLRAGGGMTSVYSDSCLRVDAADIKEAIERLCHYSVHSCAKQLSEGWFVVENGVRVGVSGVYSSGESPVLTDFTSLNFRVSRSAEGCADDIFSSNYDKNIIIAGGVNSGKTTVLRELCRLTGNIRKTALIDERNEIACLSGGTPQHDVGRLTDIISNCTRSFGISAAIRTLSPDVIVCDEIGSMEDTGAILSGIACGVRFIVTAHGTSLEELKKRRETAALIESGLFDSIVFLRGAAAPSRVKEIKRIHHVD